jgi:hypothetical protein
MIPLWFVSFLFTQAVEIPIWTGLSWRAVPAWKSALSGALCTCVTHPLLWIVWPRVFFLVRDWPLQIGGIVVSRYTAYLVTGEFLVAVIESMIFYFAARSGRFSKALAISFIANAASLGLGVLARSFGWLH